MKNLFLNLFVVVTLMCSTASAQTFTPANPDINLLSLTASNVPDCRANGDDCINLAAAYSGTVPTGYDVALEITPQTGIYAGQLQRVILPATLQAGPAGVTYTYLVQGASFKIVLKWRKFVPYAYDATFSTGSTANIYTVPTYPVGSTGPATLKLSKKK